VTTPSARPVAVIGGGWAGCAAAVALAHRGHRVALYEAAATLGGRARRVVSDGLPLDNGQHLLLGAYVETRRAIAQVHEATALPFALAPLAVAPLAPGQPRALSLRARRLPAPFGLLAGLLLAEGLPLRDRIATARWFGRLRSASYRCAAGATVTDLLADLPSTAVERLWAPLCIAALNTAPRIASGRVFANVLRAAFDGVRDGSDLVVHSADLAALFPEAAAGWLVARGHEVHVRTGARFARSRNGEPALLAGTGRQAAEAVVVAVGPHQLARAFDTEVVAGDPAVAAAIGLAAALAYEPIVTVYLGYAAAVAIPRGLVRLDDTPGQWVFDRRDILARRTPDAPRLASLLAVVISAHGAHEALDRSALAATVDAQLRRLVAGLPPLAWSRVIAERRATYACTPGAARPSAGRLAAGVYLAGDYTDPDFPATLEAAIRSGRRAAAALAADIAG
jgi:squalene-associated FAD-dependent desaturase